MKFGVVVFPGSNCDRDVAYVTGDLLQQPTRMVWHEETDITDLDVVSSTILSALLLAVASAMATISAAVRSRVFLP